jgi:hypothetical protein
MALTLMACAEHYFFDIALGWAYAAVVILAWNRIEAWRSARRAAPSQT